VTGWRIFDTEADAESYARGVWAKMLAVRAVQFGGTLRDVDGRNRPAAEADLVKLDADELERLPLYGRRYDGTVVADESGWTVRWAIPAVTAKGLWAVECPEWDDGDPEPEWPPPPDLRGQGADAPVKLRR
jgi:hypothetical protein